MEFTVLPSSVKPLNPLSRKVEEWQQHDGFAKKHIHTRLIVVVATPIFTALTLAYHGAALTIKAPITVLKYSILLIPVKINNQWRPISSIVLPKGFEIGEVVNHLFCVIFSTEVLVAYPLFGLIGLLSPSLSLSINEELGLTTLHDKSKSVTAKVKQEPLSMKEQIEKSAMDISTKQKALEKFKQLSGLFSVEKTKAEKWLEGILKVPFGVYTSSPVTKKSPPEAIKKYLQKVASDLESSVHGHTAAKEAVIDWICSRISNNASKGECLGLEGPPGVGKTTFAKKGIAKALGRPFAFISMGGQTDSAYLIGHGYTYVGSDWGRIVEILREAKCMDPVIYIDEVDKISKTEKGQELIGVLTALTDFSQNDEFQDKYFTGVKFDLSRALFIFSYNDPSQIDKVFMDRLKVIKTEAQSNQDKIAIAKKHLLPEILAACGLQEGQILIDDKTLLYLIENYTFEAGARKLKENLFTIVRGINKNCMINPGSFKLPYTITTETITTFCGQPKIELQKVSNTPTVGMINGLYATDIGVGGVLNIQVVKTPAAKKMALQLTGNLKDVMKESMEVSRSVAYNLLSDEQLKKLHEQAPEGLHIHLPSGAMPKDGPSAGGAITAAIVSRLTNTPLKGDVAMTGEIDLAGNILKIGGLDAKLLGAKRAGAKLVLIPKDNMGDLKKCTTRFPGLLSNDFKVVPVDNIHDVLDHVLVSNPIKKK